MAVNATAAPPAPVAVAKRIPGALGRVAVSAAGGLLLFFAFPPTGWWFCAPIGVALLTVALYGARPRRAAWIGYGGALAFLIPALSWLRPIGNDVWFVVAAVEGLFWLAQSIAVALVTRLRRWPVWVACLWVVQEWLRGRIPFGGFPWVRLAFSQGESPYTQFAALAGAPFVTFMVALTGTLLSALVIRLATRRRWDGAIAGTLAAAIAVPVMGLLVPRPVDEGRTVRIGVVQGNVPGRGMNFLGDEPAVVLRNHADATHRLAQEVRAGRLPRPDLVVWPENSTDIDPYRNEFARRLIDEAAKDVGVPILVGAVVNIGTEHRATRGLVWDPVTGPGAYYDKRKLVPFGEYTPLQDLMLAISSRARLVGRQSIAGDTPGALPMGPVTVGTVECYEVAFDGVVRDTVNAGGSPLVVQTNNATYALTVLPPQQLAMSQLRAVEHNRAVVTAATTGISAYVHPDGRVLWRTGELVSAVNVVQVPVRTATTLATRVGALPEWVLILMGAGATASAGYRARRKN
ncbi:apolipoprotein N-acyltransferase [Thermobispora bispora]|uniref:Apolipoprotein N-acyltransferase n=1 Tax=Thermobispora bispora (strain ATCC 19993 / DSM 43833 / CBS 139.67 / JCM 10125 / KCTC 9307 / NBRC 14880 / R51) TaxID=469371 RepID=D6YBG0_THEBD|nr:apolipoprotein N-acyltransferase [Thermobispora bispora]ADG88520.1 apolipoprotein N-acyltransferase [Thermobispora bispora DSM 43833]MDI9580968.1 apolipoprotein N-acyltransferase [Thermobispora sp.]